VSNIGFGLDASHTKNRENKAANLPGEAMHFPLQHPPFVIRDTEADDFTELIMFSGVSSKLNRPIPASTLTIELVINQAIAHLNANNNTYALSLLESAIAFYPELSSLNYGKAIALARLGRINEAVESLKRLLARVPKHQKGKQLLSELCTSIQQ
jgi:tetratricopeptide (TPR) repeat protein